jgi:energy-converting hydrogenase B subunit F
MNLPNLLIPLMVIIPITCALFLNLLHEKSRTVKAISMVVAIAIPIIPLLANYGVQFFGGYPPLIQNPSIAIGLPEIITNTALYSFHPAITYVFGSAQRLMVFILGMVALFVIFISLYEVKKPSGVYIYLILMGTASIFAMLLSDDIFNLYVFFEIAALAQVGIVLVSKVKGNYETALQYMIVGSIAAPMLLLGIALLLGVTGNVNISDIVFSIKTGLVNPYSPVMLMACALIIFGWLYGTGLPPFHTIKSAMYSKALPTGAAVLQAFSVFSLVALGVIIIRIFSYLPFAHVFIVAISLIAMVLGITMAITQTDFKRLIGYLAVGELGYIGIGLGLGTTLSITAGLFQAVNEAVITAFLFIGFGTIMYKTKETDMRKLGGMLLETPKSALLVLLAGLALAGVPPFNAFQSKLMLVQSSLNAGFPEIAIIMVLLSIVTFMTFMRAFHTIYLRPKPAALEIKNEKIPNVTIVAMVIFLGICLVFGLYPQLATNMLQGLAISIS